MSDLVIVGASGMGKETAWIVEDLEATGSDHRLVGFVDDDPSRTGSTCLGYPVLGTRRWLARREGEVAVCVAIGEPELRRRLVAQLRAFRHVTLMHPSARVHASTRIGEGTIMCAGTVVSVEVEVGRHVILNYGCTVSHGTRLGDFVVLAPGVHVAGDAEIGRGTVLGTGVQTAHDVRVGADTLVGAGAVVIADIPDRVVAVGNPARVTRSRTPGERAFGTRQRP